MLTPIYIACYALAIVTALWNAADVSKFLKAHPRIDSTTDLEAFKQLARRGMYFALGQIAVLGTGILIGLFYLTRQGCFGLLVLLLANGALLAVGIVGWRLEKKARSILVDDEELAAEYQHVCTSWVKKVLPDF